MSKDVSKNRLNNMEFLRIVSCIVILIAHLQLIGSFIKGVNIPIYKNFVIMTKESGFYAVSIFFLLAGLFFGLTFNPKNSLLDFLKKKLIRLYPVAIFTLILGALTSICYHTKWHLYNAIFALFSINGIGIERNAPNDANGVYWFVSAMLWTFLLFYYLLQNYSRKNANLIIAILIYLSAVFTYNPNLYNKMVEQPLIAVSCIGIGYFISQWYLNNKTKIENYKTDLKEIILITVIEILSLYFVIYYQFFGYIKENRFCFVIVAALVIVLFLLKKGFISRILDWKGWNFFSKYTYSIYMVHCVVYLFLKHYVIKNFINHPLQVFAVLVFSGLICGILTYYVIEKPLYNYLYKKFNIKKC